MTIIFTLQKQIVMQLVRSISVRIIKVNTSISLMNIAIMLEVVPQTAMAINSKHVRQVKIVPLVPKKLIFNL